MIISGIRQALNEYFEENGFTSMRLINNLGSTMVYLFLFAIALLLLPLLKLAWKEFSENIKAALYAIEALNMERNNQLDNKVISTHSSLNRNQPLSS
jgi:hypothetical protein